jgi:hypothetical protein
MRASAPWVRQVVSAQIRGLTYLTHLRRQVNQVKMMIYFLTHRSRGM